MSFADWESNGWLVRHQTSVQEIADRFVIADRDLKDCLAVGLSSDWRFNIAYNAALQLAAAALAAAGYRPPREAHHYRLIQSLSLTIGADGAFIKQLDGFRKKRNVGGYEQAGMVSDQEVKEMRELATGLRGEVESWLRSNYPGLWQGSTGETG